MRRVSFFQVYSFDPTLRQAQFNRSANIHFFPIGLSGRNEKKSREGFVEQVSLEIFKVTRQKKNL